MVPPPRIRINGKKEVTLTNGQFDIKDKIREKCVIRDWVVLYTGYNKRDYDLAEQLALNLKKVGKKLGIKVKKPDFVKFKFNPRGGKDKIVGFIKRYVKSYGKNNKRNPKMILCLIDNKHQSLYSFIKEATYKDLGILSQVVLKDTITG